MKTGTKFIILSLCFLVLFIVIAIINYQTSISEASIILPAENPNGTIDTYSWSDIQRLANAHLSAEEYKNKYGIELGQIKDGKYILIDFNYHDGFAFIFDTGHNIGFNQLSINTNGYAGSDIAKHVESLYQNFGDDLMSAIKKVQIDYNMMSNNRVQIQTTEFHLFLPSLSELGISNLEGIVDRKPFAYCVEAGSIKTISKFLPFWTRDIDINNTTNCWVVNPLGNEHSDNASRANAVFAVFVIG